MAALAFLILCLGSVTAALSLAHPTQVDQFGSPGDGDGQLSNPGGLAADPASGDVFVADTANNRISVFDSQGEFLRAFGWGVKTGTAKLEVCTTSCQAGIAGSGDGQFEGVIGVALSPLNGDLLTLSQGDGRVQELTPAGGFVRAYGGYDESDPAKFAAIFTGNGIAVDSKGSVYVSNRGPNFVSRVSVFDSVGTYQRQITGQASFRPFEQPEGLSVDSKDNLYLIDADYRAEQVKEFGPDGVFIRTLVTAPHDAVGGIAVDPADDHVFVTVGSEADGGYTLREYDATGNLVETTPVFGLTPFTTAEKSFGLALGTAARFPGSAPGAFYLPDRGAGQVLVLTQPAPAAPSIEGVAPGGVGGGFADIVGQVNANGAETTYFVEYGPTAGYGSVAPATPLGIGSTYDAKRVSVHLAGLAPGTIYHYSLVATNAAGTTRSTDAVFATTEPGDGLPPALPDGRAYEMVSPVEKLSNDIIFSRNVPVAAAPLGGAVTYQSLNGLPGSEAGTVESFFVGRRTPSGWTAEPLSAPSTNQFGGAQSGIPVMVSSDLSESVVQDNLDLSGGEAAPSNDKRKLFLRTASPRSYRLLTPYGSPVQTNFIAIGSSEDFSRVFFETDSPVTAEVHAPPNGRIDQVYEWSAGTLRAIGILPGETLPAAGGANAFPDGYPGAVSSDGSRVIFKAPGGGTSEADLYMRIDGNRTVKLSPSETSMPEPNQLKTLLGAAADGSVVYFTTAQDLTDDASPASSPDLYRFDVEAEKLVDLTPDGKDFLGANVSSGVVSEDGSTVYFAAEGSLAAGATPGSNLYRWNNVTGLDFIAPLVPSYDQIGFNQSQVNYDGSVLVFNSRAFLPGTFDTGEELNPVGEIFRYSLADDRIVCVSCTAPGVRPTGGAMNFAEPANLQPAQGGNRVFFSTKDPLVPQDANGVSDVYEWENGRQSLISSGRGTYGSVLTNGSRSGDDVFFLTRDRLLPRDVDDNIDLYDARVGGGFPEPSPGVSCVESACRPAAPPVAAPPGTGSASFNGPGNVRGRAQVCHRKKRRTGKHAKGKSRARSKVCSKKSGARKHRKKKRHSNGRQGR